jgi:DNA repair exonuclease SbcCD ATPase subunit
MIINTIEEMICIVVELKQDLLEDIEDVKQANHEKLLNRNDIKLKKMEQIASFKEKLNKQLVQAVQSGEDVDQYREDVNNLEEHLLELSKLNSKLATIVLPVKEMYKEIIDDISSSNGGTLLEVHA